MSSVIPFRYFNTTSGMKLAAFNLGKSLQLTVYAHYFTRIRVHFLLLFYCICPQARLVFFATSWNLNFSLLLQQSRTIFSQRQTYCVRGATFFVFENIIIAMQWELMLLLRQGRSHRGQKLLPLYIILFLMQQQTSSIAFRYMTHVCIYVLFFVRYKCLYFQLNVRIFLYFNSKLDIASLASIK